MVLWLWPIGADELTTQLGVVWKVEMIEEIIEAFLNCIL
jgi:hypothetical protein